MIALGIDIGGTTVKAAAIEISGCGARTIATVRSRTPYANPDAGTLENEIRTLAKQLPSPDRLGLCLPGLFDPARRAITASVNLPKLVGVDLDSLLRAAAAWPRAKVVTDAHAAAFDVQQTHAIRARLLAISLGTGIGACVLDDGVPLRVSPPDAGFSSGHLGHIDLSMAVGAAADTPIARDGSLGTAEAYLGAPALHARLGIADDAHLPPLAPDDPAVLALVRMVRIAHAIYRPDVVALLGGVSFAVAHLGPDLKARISDRLTSLARPNWSLIFAQDGFHAARGAARLAVAP
jgi:predicted NBD/HSP70 family sugar kinase